MSDTKVLKNSTVSGSLDVVSFPGKRGTKFTSSILILTCQLHPPLKLTTTSAALQPLYAGSCNAVCFLASLFCGTGQSSLPAFICEPWAAMPLLPLHWLSFNSFIEHWENPPQDVFKDALTPISKLSIYWSLSLTSSGFNTVADLGYPAPLWIAPHQPGLLLPVFFPDWRHFLKGF